MDPMRYQSGFSLVELLIVLVLGGILLGLGVQGFKIFNRTASVKGAAQSVLSDVTLLRSYAIQRRTNVSLVANEAGRSYVIREAGTGTVLARRSYDASSELPLTTLDVQTTGDSITFNSRGLMVPATSTDTISVGRLGDSRLVVVNALGRGRVLVP